MVLSDKVKERDEANRDSEQRTEVGEVAVEQFADALMVLQTEVVVLRGGRWQADEAVNWQAEGIRAGTGTRPIQKEVWWS